MKISTSAYSDFAPIAGWLTLHPPTWSSSGLSPAIHCLEVATSRQIRNHRYSPSYSSDVYVGSQSLHVGYACYALRGADASVSALAGKADDSRLMPNAIAQSLEIMHLAPTASLGHEDHGRIDTWTKAAAAQKFCHTGNFKIFTQDGNLKIPSKQSVRPEEEKEVLHSWHGRLLTII